MRTILHKKKSSALILLGIVIGMSSVMLIYTWLIYQTSFDRFHQKYNEIYRVIISESGANNAEGLAEMHADIHPLLLENIPEISYCARFKPFDKCVVKKKEKLFYEAGIAAVDSSFFDIFSFSILSSNGKKPMVDPFDVYISEEIAIKYFGNSSPISQSLKIDTLDVIVAGVFKSWPDNSHLTFDILIPHDLLKRFGVTHPWNNYLYITVDDQIDTDQLAKNISDLATQNNSIISRLHMKLGLQPLSDIHFTTSLGSEVARTEQKSKLFFFGTIAFLIIVFSVINFTTLIFVDQLKGLRNIAVKKTLGSSKRKLFIELLTKSLIFILVAFLVAGSIVELVKPQFVNFTNTNIIETGIGIHGIILMLGIFILAVFIGGLYPNILLSSLSPSFILRTDNRFKTRNLSTRNILLIIQFTVSLILIICTLISLRQLNFMLQHDSGFNRKNIIMVPAREPLVQRFDILKQELLKNPSIDGVTLQSRSFHSGGQDYAHWVGKEEQENVIVDVFAVEHDFCKLLGIEIIEGRDFSKEIITDNTGAFIVNREAADQMGLENPVGKTIFANQRNGEIIGITNNAYFRSLKKDIEPAVFYIYDSFVLPWIYNQGIILVKFREGEEEAVISDLEKFWIKFNQEQPFEYEFLDREFNSMYENEKQNAMLFELFSVIAIIISCLGLYAVISHGTEERTKEIGIRKAMGATPQNIVSSFSSNLLWCFVISFLISIPTSYFIMDQWLKNFVQKLPIAVWIFFVAFIIVVAVSYLTIIFNVRKAAIRNPVDSLRYE